MRIPAPILAAKRGALRAAIRRSSLLQQLWALKYGKVIVLDFPFQPSPRYGYGAPPHAALQALIESGRERYAGLLAAFGRFEDGLAQIPAAATEPGRPAWQNDQFTSLDAVALYGLLGELRPQRLFEIGSGNSTAFARQAITDLGLATTLTSIDSAPRKEIDELCDRAIRTGLEEVELSLFDELERGDLVFFDGSHHALMNSDATVFFLDVLPRLPSGVLVGVHDIYLPNDYPPEWRFRYYSEQYLLATWLLAAGDRIEIVLPLAFVSGDPLLTGVIESLRKRLPKGIEPVGTGFWFRTP